MRFLLVTLLLIPVTASAQQLMPLTDWRAQIDVDLAKIPMSRDAHGQVIGILQAAERAAQVQQQLQHKEPPPPTPMPPPPPEPEKK